MLTRALHFGGRLSSLPQQLLFLANVSCLCCGAAFNSCLCAFSLSKHNCWGLILTAAQITPAMSDQKEMKLLVGPEPH